MCTACVLCSKVVRGLEPSIRIGNISQIWFPPEQHQIMEIGAVFLQQWILGAIGSAFDSS